MNQIVEIFNIIIKSIAFFIVIYMSSFGILLIELIKARIYKCYKLISTCNEIIQRKDRKDDNNTE